MEIVFNRLEEILNEEALELRGDGRAGSGVVLVMQSLAMVAMEDPSLHFQEWPFFSAARKGVPIRGFLRISRKPIEKISEILTPHISILMDEEVTRTVDFAEGTPRGAIFIVNSPATPEAIAKKFKLTGRVYTIDGNKIGERHLKKPMGNISVFALLVDILPGFHLKKAREKLGDMLKKRRMPESLVNANCDLFDASIGQAQSGDFDFATSQDHRTTEFQGYPKLVPGAQSSLRLSRSNHTSSYARSGAILKFADPENTCNGCGHCIINCPENIIQFVPDPEIGVRVTGADIVNYCKLCRECIAICPKKLFMEVRI